MSTNPSARLVARLLPVLSLAACVHAGTPAPAPDPARDTVPTPPPVAEPVAERAPTAQPTPAPQEESEAEFDQTHAAWTAVLRGHVHGDRFDYAAVKADPAGLKAYLRQLKRVTKDELAGWTREQRFAFWINAYNAFTIKKVVDNYPLKSIRDLSGALGLSSVFDNEFIPLTALHPEGKDDKLSLNDIEHGILRPRFEDARVHAAVNCASESCPPLRAEAFVAERLNEQLDEQMRAFIADRSRNRFDHEDGRLELSQIFKWFSEDFERDAGSVQEFVARYAPEDQAEFARGAKVRYLDYSWKLNDVEKPR